MSLNERRTVAKLFFEHHGNDPRTILATAGEWIGVTFATPTDETLREFRDCFADHLIAGWPSGQSVNDLVLDLVWGDIDQAHLDKAAERAARDLALRRAKRLGV